MNRFLFIISLTAVLSACNNENTTGANNTTDTTNHNTHVGTSGNITATSTDTASIAGGSMMSRMMRNMDQMKSMTSTGSADKDFAAMMKVHHVGAVEMAQLELAQGTDAQLKQMAQKIIDAQQKEISQFDAFLSSTNTQTNNPTKGSSAFHQQVMGQMNNMNMEMDHSGSVDKQFAQMMIPHHQGGIDMANAYLKGGAQNAELKTMANKIIADQQREINELQAWLTKNK